MAFVADYGTKRMGSDRALGADDQTGKSQGNASPPMHVDISIIIPAYNEEKRLPAFLDALIAHCGHSDYRYEIIVVNDGSHDATGQLCDGYANRHDLIRALHNPINKGKGFSVRKGFFAARGAYQCFLDADGSVTPDEIETNLPYLKDGGYDIFIGSRVLHDEQQELKVRWHRRLCGTVFNSLVKHLLFDQVRDTQCGFKLFKRDVVKPLFSQMRLQRFGFDIELLYLAFNLGFRVKEGAVSWHHVDGSKVNLLTDSARMFGNILQIRTWHRRPTVQASDCMSENRWRLGVVAALFASILWCLMTGAGPDFMRWDNFEQHTPLLIETHSQWLQGAIPYWNRHQHMGEPLLANGQPGVFYLPYTAQLGAMRAFGVADRHFPLGVILLHLPLMGLGCYQLLRAFRVRRSFSCLAAVNMGTSGYLAVYQSVWIFLSPIFAWTPWILLGIVRSQDGPRRRSGTVLTACSLAAVGLVGHPQFTLYVWLLTILFGLGRVVGALHPLQKIARLIPALVAGACLSAPAILPVLYLLPYSDRSTPFSLADFLGGALPFEALSGLLLPLYRSLPGRPGMDMPMLCHMGTWLPLSLVSAFALSFRLRRKSKARRPINLGGAFRLNLAMAALFILFALGKAGVIYPLTYWIPVWSSFRWPLKFLPYAQLALGLAGGIGLEIACRNTAKARHVRVAVALACLSAGAALLVALGSAHLRTASGLLSLAAAVGTLAGFVAISRPWGRALLVGSGLASALAMAGLVQQKDMKSYTEPYASIGANELGIDTSHYVLPLSHHAWGRNAPSSMQSHGLFHAATMNRYLCATGVTTGLAPAWYLRWLPSSPWALLPAEASKILLQGSYLPALGIKYLIVSSQDEAMLQTVNQLPGVTKVTTCEEAQIYEFPQAAPLVYFASELGASSLMNQVFFQAHSWNGTALLDNPPATGKLPPGAQVQNATFKAGARVDIDVIAPDGGFLVLNQTYFPQWHARVDGKPAELLRVNGFVQGLAVPPGSRRVELRWRSSGLAHGLTAAVCGLLVLWAGTRQRQS